MKAGCIYVVTNKVNGDQYVGLTHKPMAYRWGEHKTCARSGRKSHFYSAIRKYGIDNFEIQEFVSVLSIDSLGPIERAVIKQLRPVYNQTNGGEFTAGKKHTPEMIERIRQKNTGKKRTPEQNALNSQLGKERWATNFNLREKCLAALEKGRANRDEEKRLAAVRKHHETYKWSDESRAKLSASCMGRRYGPEVIEKGAAAKRKAVKCNETGEIFSCREEAAKRTGVSCRTIFRDVQGENRKPAKGRLTFSYI